MYVFLFRLDELNLDEENVDGDSSSENAQEAAEVEEGQERVVNGRDGREFVQLRRMRRRRCGRHAEDCTSRGQRECICTCMHLIQSYTTLYRIMYYYMI